MIWISNKYLQSQKEGIQGYKSEKDVSHYPKNQSFVQKFNFDKTVYFLTYLNFQVKNLDFDQELNLQNIEITNFWEKIRSWIFGQKLEI